MSRNSVMSLNHISKSFPGVRTLYDISFELGEGEVSAPLDENGVGKLTLVEYTTGAYGLTEESIELFGKGYHTLAPSVVMECEINAVYQEFNLMMDLPTVGNVFMGNNSGHGILVDYPQTLKRCKEVLETFSIGTDPEDDVSVLSPAMIQITEIARAIMLDLKILILDRPTAPLTTKEIRTLFQIIDRLGQQGASATHISHRLGEVFEICDRVVVIRDGGMVGGTATGNTSRTRLIRMIIGRELARLLPVKKPHISEEISLSLRNVSENGNGDISFEVHKGEILGVAGLVGTGKTELMDVILYDVPREAGSVFVNRREFKGTQPWHTTEQGISYLSEDRKRRGLLLDKSITINLSLANVKKRCKSGIIDRKKGFSCVDFYCRKSRVETPDHEDETQYLSGGNQQKVIVGKWLAIKSDIVVFDEPTRRIDVGAKYETYEIINQLTNEGKAIIVVSSESGELVRTAGRIITTSEERLADEVGREEFDKELLLDMASGSH